MPSPFPGMDPYIESQYWQGFHHNLLSEAQRMLAAGLLPRYLVLVEERVYVEHWPEAPDQYLADVAVAAASRNRTASGGAAAVIEPGAIETILPMPEEVRENYLTIRRGDTKELVTVVEVLSPSNKRPGDGRTQYVKKRQEVLLSDANLVELDLLRGGPRLPTQRPLPQSDYLYLVSRADRRPHAVAYPWTLRQELPTVRVPLTGDDPDALIDLQQAFSAIYDTLGYRLILDYTAPVEPALAAEDRAWADTLLLRSP